jgi:hypothetical protein
LRSAPGIARISQQRERPGLRLHSRFAPAPIPVGNARCLELLEGPQELASLAMAAVLEFRHNLPLAGEIQIARDHVTFSQLKILQQQAAVRD